MTKQELNIAIAKERGFTVAFRGEEHWMPFELKNAEGKVVKCTNSEHMAWKCAPDYTTDLNAMHEVEKELSPKLSREYMQYLSRVIVKDDKDIYWEDSAGSIQTYTFHATAVQRTEAYLRVKGILKD